MSPLVHRLAVTGQSRHTEGQQRMTTNTTTTAARIDALTTAVEFIQCAVRDLAHGKSFDDAEDSPSARMVLEWAEEKMKEAMGAGEDRRRAR